MPTYQSGSNIVVAYKVQSALGTPATGASGRVLRITGGAGLSLTPAIIRSNELRSDGQTTRGRHGTASSQGSFDCELSVASLDEIFRALFRASAETATTTRTYDNSAGLTSLQITQTNEITQVGTTTLIGVVHRGDLIKLGGMSTAANNDVWAMVKSVTATVITVYGTPFTTQAADIACTLVTAKKLIQGDPPTERYFTFDQHGADVDLSQAFYDVKIASARFSKQPNQPVMVTVGLIGLDADALATGASPSLTSPTEYTTRPLVMADGTLAIGGTVYTDITAFEFTVNLGGAAPPVLAPNPPDVFLDNARVDGSFQSLVTDYDHFTAMLAETQQEIAIHLVEPETNPKDGMSIYLGDAIIDSHQAPPGGSGGQVVTCQFHAGKDEGGSDRAATMVKLSSTAAAL